MPIVSPESSSRAVQEERVLNAMFGQFKLIARYDGRGDRGILEYLKPAAYEHDVIHKERSD